VSCLVVAISAEPVRRRRARNPIVAEIEAKHNFKDAGRTEQIAYLRYIDIVAIQICAAVLAVGFLLVVLILTL
jgi:hypothetical protein